jgi:hypothetical protein
MPPLLSKVKLPSGQLSILARDLENAFRKPIVLKVL